MAFLKFSEISSFQFNQTLQKIVSTPTHGESAAVIHKLAKQVTEARDKVAKDYQDKIANVFGKRDAEGKLLRPEGEPNGFEPMEEKQKELETALEEFGKTLVEVNCSPLTIKVIGETKVSALDLESLKGLYSGNPSPGPELPDNVSSLR